MDHSWYANLHPGFLTPRFLTVKEGQTITNWDRVWTTGSVRGGSISLVLKLNLVRLELKAHQEQSLPKNTLGFRASFEFPSAAFNSSLNCTVHLVLPPQRWKPMVKYWPPPTLEIVHGISTYIKSYRFHRKVSQCTKNKAKTGGRQCLKPNAQNVSSDSAATEGFPELNRGLAQ